MKIFKFLFFLVSSVVFSQQKQLFSNELNIYNVQFITTNLDDIVIENNDSSKLEIILENENSIPLRIETKEGNNELIVSFKKEQRPNFNSPVFRKYITKRLERARVLIKVPKSKNVTIHGNNVGVLSKSYKGNVSVYIDKGNVRLGKIKGDALIKLFLGNVYADVTNTNLKLKTTKGIIEINKHQTENNFEDSNRTNSFNLSVNSIHANIYLTKK